MNEVEQFNLYNLYQKTAKQAVNDYYLRSSGEFPTLEELSHIMDLSASIMMTRDNFIIGGSFVRAVVDNDLAGAVYRADSTAGKHLPLFVHVLKFIHINQ